MRKALSSVLFLVVAGCASVPSSTAPSVEQQWSAYQASIREQRDAGVMNAVGMRCLVPRSWGVPPYACRNTLNRATWKSAPVSISSTGNRT